MTNNVPPGHMSFGEMRKMLFEVGVLPPNLEKPRGITGVLRLAAKSVLFHQLPLEQARKIYNPFRVATAIFKEIETTNVLQT